MYTHTHTYTNTCICVHIYRYINMYHPSHLIEYDCQSL